MDEKYLPIGTVVLLENGTKELMITGYCVMSPNDPGNVYDYSGCIYPEGIMRSDINCVFNHSQIVSILSMGYISEVCQTFLDNLKEMTKEEEETNEPLLQPIEETVNFDEIERL